MTIATPNPNPIEAAPSSVVIVPEMAEHRAGGVVWWSLSGTVDIAALSVAWMQAGLDAALLPSMITPDTALKRTAGSFRETRQLVRPLPAGGWAIVREGTTEDNTDLTHETLVVATVNALGMIEVYARDNTYPEARVLANKVREAYPEHRDNYTRGDISRWLVDLAERLQVVGLRETGGIYYMPENASAKWAVIVGIVHRVTGCKIYRIPAVRGEEAVAAVLDMITRETTSTIAALHAEIDAGQIGKRALATREAQCRAMQTKLEAYRDLLGDRLNDITTKVTETRAAVSEAISLSMGGDDDAS